MEKNQGKLEKKRSFWKDETGDIGIKQIAITVGVIVLVGMSISIINGKMGDWFEDIWEIFITYIETNITGK